MRKKKELSLKDRITIHIKKTKPMTWLAGVLLSVILLVLLIVVGQIDMVDSKKAPSALNEGHAYRMTFIGDVEISDSVRTMANKIGYKQLFKGVSKYWENSDYVVANISGPVLRYDKDNYTSTRDKTENSVYVRPAALRGFKSAGIDLLSFANDDAYNYGMTGIRSTIETVVENEMEYAGIALTNEEPVYITKTYEVTKEDGTTTKRAVAIFCINDAIMANSTVGANRPGVVNASIGNIYEKVYEATTVADNVVVYVHFSEGEGSAVTDEQELVAHSMIDAGADLVIGNSTELQHLEKYGDGIIAYGLGSSVSDDLYTTQRDGSMLDFIVTNSGEVKVYLTPLRVSQGRPVVIDSGWYRKRVTSVLTTKFDKDNYHILDSGIIEISLGQLGEPVYVEPTAEPAVTAAAEQ